MTPEHQHCRSVLSSFRSLCETIPQRLLFTFVDEKGQDSRTLHAHQLAASADGVARLLRSQGLLPGDRAVLVYPPSIDFIEAFVGCLAAGVVPVPVYPPHPMRPGRSIANFSRIVVDSGARIALTNGYYERARRMGSIAGVFGRSHEGWPRVPWVRTDGRASAAADPTVWYQPRTLDEPAFLQYTSGSTAAPKGVIVTHGNLAHEIAANVVDLRLGPTTRGVFWIPQYHDMGLINVILSTVVGNSQTHLMSPFTFLRRPAVWLDVMSRVRATVTAAPNFAYEVAVRRTTPQMRATWDLSCLQMLIAAAEPVRPKTIHAFVDAFAVSGIRRDMFFTAYGLAENTASVTNRGQRIVRLDKRALERGRARRVDDDDVLGPTASYAGCGFSSKKGDRIRIVDPDTRIPCPTGTVGEIWVRSSTTAAGYWGMEQLSQEIFHATVVGDDDPTEYMRTSDLGFMLDGELFATGRLADRIIVNGRSLYPTDIEDSVRSCHPFIRSGGVVAISVDPADDIAHPAAPAGPWQPGERLVLLVELTQKRLYDDEVDEICARIRSRVQADHDIACHTIVLGQPGLVKKTTSGKVRRRPCKQAYLRGEIHRAAATIRVQLPGTDDAPTPRRPVGTYREAHQRPETWASGGAPQSGGSLYDRAALAHQRPGDSGLRQRGPHL